MIGLSSGVNMSPHARPTPDHIIQVGLGFWASKALLSAVEIGVFTELASGPQDLSKLAGRLGLHQRSARDFLDALVALGFLRRADGTYGNTPETDLFLDRHKPSYIGGILEMANARLFGFWGHLTEALRTGKPQNESKENGGSSPFVALYADRARLKAFLAAMSGISHGANLAIACAFKREIFLRENCRTWTSSPWGTSCTIGTWKKRTCWCAKPTGHLIPGER